MSAWAKAHAARPLGDYLEYEIDLCAATADGALQGASRRKDHRCARRSLVSSYLMLDDGRERRHSAPGVSP